MLAGAIVGGSLPLYLGISGNGADLTSGVAAGCLVGCVLGVILPEAFHVIQDVHKARGEQHSEHHEEFVQEWLIGIILIAGYLGMLALSNLLPHSHTSSHQIGLSTGLHGAAKEKKGVAIRRLLVGLVAHSVADGLAVGAAGLANNTCVTLLVGVAMVLHKGPAAFGFTAYLLATGESKPAIQQGLLIFSVASPAAAIITYGLQDWIPVLQEASNIGLVMIFSAGSFLYVACSHVLPEVAHKSGSLSSGQLTAIFLGSLVPLCLSSFIGHGH